MSMEWGQSEKRGGGVPENEIASHFAYPSTAGAAQSLGVEVWCEALLCIPKHTTVFVTPSP